MRTRNILPLLLAVALSLGIQARGQDEPNGLPPELHQLLRIAAERSLAKSEKAKKVLTNDLSIASLSLLRDMLARRPLPNRFTPQEEIPSPAALPKQGEDEGASPQNQGDVRRLSGSSNQNPILQEGRAETFHPETTPEAVPASEFSRTESPTRRAPQAASVRDERLVGRWQRMEYRAGTVASVTRYYTAVLNQDGHGSISASSETGFGGDLRGGSQSESALPGRWSTSGSRLIVQWASEDPEAYHYELRGNGTGGIVLRLHPAGGGPLQEWSRLQ